MKNYVVRYTARTYQKGSVGYNYATVNLWTKANNKIDAINNMISVLDHGSMYQMQVGYYPAKVELEKIESVTIQK